MWRLRYSEYFRRAAKKIDRAVLQRIVTYLGQLEELPDPRTKGKALSGNLSGYWRYRIGDYRVLVEINDNDLIIIAITVGHRRDIYRR